MACKFTVGKVGTVLIDTWWNVNKMKPAQKLYEDIVLIDTWWNVNTDFYPKAQQTTMF